VKIIVKIFAYVTQMCYLYFIKLNDKQMKSFKEIYEIAQKVRENKDFDFIGVRVQEDFNEKIGDTLTHRSFVWIDGEETTELLNGVCAIDANNLNHTFAISNGAYSGDVILILGCNGYCSRGEDVAEIIMNNPTIINIIK